MTTTATAVTWHRITTDKKPSVEPADKGRVWVRNGHGERPAKWDGNAREWYLGTPEVDWRASAACYEEWCDWDSHVPAPEPVAEPAQMGMGL